MFLRDASEIVSTESSLQVRCVQGFPMGAREGKKGKRKAEFLCRVDACLVLPITQTGNMRALC